MLRISLLPLLMVASMATGHSGDYEFAGEEKVPLETVPVSDWHNEFAANAWITQVNIRFADESLGISNNVFLGFDTIIKNLDWIVPLTFDMRYKQFGFMPDIFAAKLSGAGATPGPLFDRMDVSLKQVMLTLPAYVRLVDEERCSFDLVGGARYLYQNTDLTLSGGPLGGALGPVNSVNKVELWDGIVGGRVQCDLNDRIYGLVYGDVGTGSSDLTWQILANLGYRISDNAALEAGYRYVTWDKEDAPNDVKMTMSGPILYFRWAF